MAIPETRIEHYLDSIAYGSAVPDYPAKTRTRVENYLDYIARNSGKGSQVTEMPEPSADYYGKIVQYVGETTDDYTNGYFYKGVATSPATTVTFANNKIACSNTDFLAFLQEIAPDTFLTITNGTMSYVEDANLWIFTGKNANGETVVTYQQYTDDYEAEGFTFTGTFVDGETIGFTATTTATYAWERIDVQPGGGASVYETATASTWSSLTGSAPFDYQTTITLTNTLGDNSIVRLINDDAVLFANYGFSILSVTGQNVVIASIGQPTAPVNLKFEIKE